MVSTYGRELAPRYQVVAERAGLAFEPGNPVLVERAKGGTTTDFWAVEAIPSFDSEPVDEAEAARTVTLLGAAWDLFGETTATSPEELRKGPRGGGRDRDKMAAHVVNAERAYARKIGVRHEPIREPAALGAMRADLVEVLSRPSDGSPPIPGGRPVRYAARRIARHVVGHLWEMEDRRSQSFFPDRVRSQIVRVATALRRPEISDLELNVPRVRR